MQKGDIIKGYTILQDFKTAGGGLSKWSFASKNKQEYFIKEFLSPKYPTPDAPGSPAFKNKKKLECEKFEQRHQNLQKILQEKCGIGGNLVITLDFFREGTKYYKVTEKIEVASLSVQEVALLPIEVQILILKTIAHSLNILHIANIVHGDLKPDNILIKQTKTGSYTAKLIDFDDSYFATFPPELSEDMVGDMAYYSPELANYIYETNLENAQKLTTKSDIFALGLIFCVYLTGKLPHFSQKYGYACIAANNGEKIIFNDKKNISLDIIALINQMLRTEENLRPTIQEVFERLKNISSQDLQSASSGLRGKGLNIGKK
jgi:serine/threonine protein kinase